MEIIFLAWYDDIREKDGARVHKLSVVQQGKRWKGTFNICARTILKDTSEHFWAPSNNKEEDSLYSDTDGHHYTFPTKNSSMKNHNG